MIRILSFSTRKARTKTWKNKENIRTTKTAKEKTRKARKKHGKRKGLAGLFYGGVAPRKIIQLPFGLLCVAISHLGCFPGPK